LNWSHGYFGSFVVDGMVASCNVLSQCAGNRRTAMSKTKTVKGVGWDVSAIGNG